MNLQTPAPTRQLADTDAALGWLRVYSRNGIALRDGQQQMLAETARATRRYHAYSTAKSFRVSTMSPMAPATSCTCTRLNIATEDRRLFRDWSLRAKSLRSMRGADGPIQFAVGVFRRGDLSVRRSHRSRRHLRDVATLHGSRRGHRGMRIASRLISSNPPYLRESIIVRRRSAGANRELQAEVPMASRPEPAISAHWQDMPGGYRVEARIPSALLGTHLGLSVQEHRSMHAARHPQQQLFAGYARDPPMRRSSEIDRDCAGHSCSRTCA